MVRPTMLTSMDEKESFHYIIENIMKDRNQIQLLGSQGCFRNLYQLGI